MSDQFPVDAAWLTVVAHRVDKVQWRIPQQLGSIASTTVLLSPDQTDQIDRHVLFRHWAC